MINTLYFVIGFIIYVLYGIFTFRVYSKNKKINSSFIYLIIYVYYSILAGYLINLVDNYSSIEERIVEILIYIICGGLFMYSNYRIFLKNNETEWSE